VDTVCVGMTTKKLLIGITGAFDNKIIVWDLRNHTQLKILGPGGEETVDGQNIERVGHTGHIHEIRLSPTGGWFASCSGDRSIKLWDTETFKLLFTLREPFGVNCIDISTDENFILSGSRGVVRIWDLTTRKEVMTKYAHEDKVDTVAFAPDSRTFASSSGPSVHVYNRQNDNKGKSKYKLMHQLQNPSGKNISDLRFVNDGKSIQALAKYDTALCWDLSDKAGELTNEAAVAAQKLVYLNIEDNIHVRPRNPTETGFTAEGPIRVAALGPIKSNGERTGIVIEGHKPHIITES